MGKSAFARAMSDRTGAQLIDLDAIWRVQRDGDAAAFRTTLANLHAAEAWVSDGNFAAATFDIRLPQADLIVWLDRPRWLCRWRAIRRALAGDVHHRLKDLPDVLRFIDGFDAKNRPLIEAERLKHGPAVPLTRLETGRAMTAFLADPGVFSPASSVL